MRAYFYLMCLPLLLASCAEQAPQKEASEHIEVISSLEVPNDSVDVALLEYDRQTSTWSLEGKPFSGIAVQRFSSGAIQKKFGILNGKKQNESIERFPDGGLKSIAHYHKGKLHGEKKSWTPDSVHVLISHLNYYLGKPHGEQKKWYSTGEIFKVLHLNMGKEEGIQQAFRKNGVLYANYEAKEGRIFGLKKAELCYGLEDQKVKYEAE